MQIKIIIKRKKNHQLFQLRLLSHVSVLLLITNFVITLKKVAVDPQGDSQVDLQIVIGNLLLITGDP